jgi:hypothetical protein
VPAMLIVGQAEPRGYCRQATVAEDAITRTSCRALEAVSTITFHNVDYARTLGSHESAPLLDFRTRV